MLYPDNLPPDQLAQNAHNDMLLFTAVLATLIGIILTYLGRQGKQLWIVVWSVGLIICSVLMAGSILI